MPQPGTILTATGLWKSYSSVVLEDVRLDLRAGEVHALVGENGAGKSTLSRIIAGLVKPDRGRMEVYGTPYAPRSKAEAEHLGVRMVLQELNLVGTLTVAESIFIDQLPNRLGWIDYRKLNNQARAAMAQVGLSGLDPQRLINTLGIGQRQLIEIAAGLSRRCRILILDEPTAALTSTEIELLFTQIARLKALGVGIIYISHRMEEIQRIADRITILRDGKVVATQPAREISLNEIVRLMVGRELPEITSRPTTAAGPVRLRVEGLTRRPWIEQVSFEVRAGEILGFAGLMGSGRTETLRAIFGADPRDAGDIFLHDSPTPARIHSPRDAVRQGIALLTEDRKEQGILLPLAIRCNISLPSLPQVSGFGGWIRSQAENLAAGEWIRNLGVKCHSAEQQAVELSGGNQQKVVIAKWLRRDCDVLLFDEPTRGIDVGAKFEIYELLAQLAGQGRAIVMVSSDLKELLAVCDRIAVMSAGRLAATFKCGDWSQDRIMAAALSGYN